MIRHFTGSWKGMVMFDDEDPEMIYNWYPRWPDETYVRQETFDDENSRQLCINDWQEYDPDLIMDIGL